MSTSRKQKKLLDLAFSQLKWLTWTTQQVNIEINSTHSTPNGPAGSGVECFFVLCCVATDMRACYRNIPFSSVAVAITLFCFQVLAFDCIISVSSPVFNGKYHTRSFLDPKVSLEIGEGPRAKRIRENPASFAICIEWDVEWDALVLDGKSPDPSQCYPLLELDGSFLLPGGNLSSIGEGLHFFRASLVIISKKSTLPSSQPPLISRVVPFTVASLEVRGIGGAQEPTEPPRFPCTWRGTFSVVAPWSVAFSDGREPPLALAGPLVEVPVDFSGFGSWAEVQTILRGQFYEMCKENTSNENDWIPDACVKDIERQVAQWAIARCAAEDNPHQRVSREQASLERFKYEAGGALGFKNPDWTMDDVDSKFHPGAQALLDQSSDDGCGALFHKENNNGRGNGIVYIVGGLTNEAFVKRQRDFILRDILGCLSRVRICVDGGYNDSSWTRDLNEAAECEDMLRYSLQHSRDWECGRCPSGRHEGDHSAVVHVSGLSFLSGGHSEGDWLLKEAWRPNVIVHVNDEAAAPLHALIRLYQGSSLVYRMYNHGEMINGVRNQLNGTTVVTIPIGHLNGFADSSDGSRYQSGLESVRETSLRGAKSRPRLWAFVGTRGMHHPHSSDSRTSMTSFFSGLPGEGLAHLTERDGYVSAAWTASAYRGSRFVASPRGESLDCFRHYEATIAGAIPVVDGHRGDPGWSWWDYTEDALDDPSHVSGLEPLPSWPLGWVFPPEPRPQSGDGDGRLYRAPVPTYSRALTLAEWPGIFCETEWARTPWSALTSQVEAIGAEEIDLRRELNSRWYIALIQRLRRRMLHTILECISGVNIGGHKSTTEMGLAADRGTHSINAGNILFKNSVIEVFNEDELQSAVRTAVFLGRQHAGSTRIELTVVVSAMVVTLSRTLVVTGDRLHLTIRGAPPNSMEVAPVDHWGKINDFIQRGRCLLDGGDKIRVISVDGGATLHLDAIGIVGGRAFGNGGGVSVMGIGSHLSSGSLDQATGLSKRKSALAAAFMGNEIIGFSGGALYVGEGARAYFGLDETGRGSLFVANIAGSSGGGMAAAGDKSEVHLEGAVFWENSAYRGGAISVADGATVDLAQSQNDGTANYFKENVAYWDGGAIYAVAAHVRAPGACFIENAVSKGGSAVHAGLGGVIDLRGIDGGVVLWKNTAAYGGPFYSRPPKTEYKGGVVALPEELFLERTC